MALMVSGSYFAIVVGVAVFVLVVNYLEPGFAAVWLILVTLPVSVPISLTLSVLSPVLELLVLLLVLGGFGQAWVLWVVLRGKRLRPQKVSQVRSRGPSFLRKATADHSNGARALVTSGSYFAIVIGVTVFGVVADYLELEGGPANDLLWLVIWPVSIPVLLLLSALPSDIPELGAGASLFVLGGSVQAWLLWVSQRGTRLPHDS